MLERSKHLQLASENKTVIVLKIVRHQELPENINYQTFCPGSSDKGWQLAYVEIKCDLKGLFLAVLDEK